MKDFRKIISVERDCGVCHKVFSSAKALGGHMRIHVDDRVKNKDLILSKNTTPRHHSIKLKNMVGVIKKPNCMICGREFPSMKSLFGHMRCHPERDWRGIRPPSTPKNTSHHHTSSLSDADDPDHQVQVVVSTSQGNDQVVDLAESLRGWPVTARRGRKALTADSTSGSSSSSEEHDRLHKAVDDLMMLGRNDQSHSQNIDTSEAASSNLPVSSANSGSTSNIRKSSEKFRTNSPVEKSGKEKSTTSSTDVLGESIKKLDGSVLNYDQLDGTSLNPVEATQHDQYCMACNKNIPATEALGSCPTTGQPASASSRRVLNFDLNEVPPTED